MVLAVMYEYLSSIMKILLIYQTCYKFSAFGIHYCCIRICGSVSICLVILQRQISGKEKKSFKNVENFQNVKLQYTTGH